MAKDFEDFLTSNNSIIKDASVFDIGYSPEDIYKRKETFDFFSVVSDFVNYKIPKHILLIGGPGLGKTVTAKYVIRKEILKEKGIETCYVNCRLKSALTIFQELYSLLNLQHDKKAVKSKDLIISFISQLKTPLLLILDEVDRAKKIEPLLYALSRTKEISSEGSAPISLVLVANNLRWEECIDPAVRSSLQLNKIAFTPYSKNDLIKILKERVGLGFVNPSFIKEGDLNSIVDLTVKKRNGDCRVALKALLFLAQEADRKKNDGIAPSLIEKKFRDASNNIDKERVSWLEDNPLLVLIAASFAEGGSITKVCETYTNITKNSTNLKVLKKTMVYYWIGYLQQQGLLKSTTETGKSPEAPSKEVLIGVEINREVIMNEIRARMLKIGKDENE